MLLALIGSLGTERVAANEFGEVFGMVGGAGLERTHFVEHDGDACLGDLPSGFGASDAAADDVDGSVVRHSQKSNPGECAFSRIEPWGSDRLQGVTRQILSRDGIGLTNGLKVFERQ
jgi:hypothetical protein